MPNQFQFLCYKDAGITGRLEVTLVKNEVLSHVSDGQGTLVHSKEESCVKPDADYDAFFRELRRALS